MTALTQTTHAVPAAGAAQPASRRWQLPKGRVAIHLYQATLLISVLAAWQYLPSWDALSDRVDFLDPFFISSPTRVFDTALDLAFGRNGSVLVWPYVWRTLQGALLGLMIGMVGGGVLGLLFSTSPTVSKVLMPFINAINATPRVAFIPVIVVIFGPTRASSVTIAVLVVLFVSLYNAIEGGLTVPQQILENAELFGARPSEIMRHVRMRYVMAWCFASLPTALAFSLVSVVTAEVFTGYEGVGRLLLTATATVNADLTFALATFLGALGVLLVTIAERVKRRVLHWW